MSVLQQGDPQGEFCLAEFCEEGAAVGRERGREWELGEEKEAGLNRVLDIANDRS